MMMPRKRALCTIGGLGVLLTVALVVLASLMLGLGPVTAPAPLSAMEAIEEIPGVALEEGLQYDWESFPDVHEFVEDLEASFAEYQELANARPPELTGGDEVPANR